VLFNGLEHHPGDWHSVLKLLREGRDDLGCSDQTLSGTAVATCTVTFTQRRNLNDTAFTVGIKTYHSAAAAQYSRMCVRRDQTCGTVFRRQPCDTDRRYKTTCDGTSNSANGPV